MVQKSKTISEERIYIIPLLNKWRKTSRYKRANRAVKEIKLFLVRHMKVRDRDLNKIKLDKFLNETIWLRGIKKPPHRIKVKAKKEGEIVKVELVDYPQSIKFKKLREEKRDKKSLTEKEKRKIVEAPKEPIDEKKEEKKEDEKEKRKEDEKEKKAAVVEEGTILEKAAAKQMKHETKLDKQPKRRFRQALQK